MNSHLCPILLVISRLPFRRLSRDHTLYPTTLLVGGESITSLIRKDKRMESITAAGSRVCG